MIDVGDMVRYVPSDRSKETIEGMVVDIDNYPSGGAYIIMDSRTGELNVAPIRNGTTISIEGGAPMYRNMTLEGRTVDKQKRFVAPPYMKRTTRKPPTSRRSKTRQTGMHYFSENMPIPHGGTRITDFAEEEQSPVQEVNWNIWPIKEDCEEVVWMSPEDFLSRVPNPISTDFSALAGLNHVSIEEGGNGFSKNSLKTIYDAIMEGKQIDSLYLNYENMSYGWPAHEGRHRAVVAYLLGADSVPVNVVDCKHVAKRIRDWHTKRDLGNDVDEKEVIRKLEKRLRR